jgi:hypothetical protein
METKIDCARCKNFNPYFIDRFFRKRVKCNFGYRVNFRPKENGYFRKECEDYFNPNKY